VRLSLAQEIPINTEATRDVMTPGTLLIIDDDEILIDLLSKYFAKHGWATLSATTPDEGMRLIKEKSPRLVVLDVMLPEKDGFQTCREIRAFSTVPIVMLTARGEVTDRIVGLEMGADDYLSKPFEPRELLARMQSILRRTAVPVPAEKSADAPMRFGPLEIDPFKRTVNLRGSSVDLTTTEFDVLTLFAKNPGKVMNRNEVMDQLRGINWQAFDRSIDVLISRIRHKLKDDAKHPLYFKTVWGVGYVFVGKAEG